MSDWDYTSPPVTPHRVIECRVSPLTEKQKRAISDAIKESRMSAATKAIRAIPDLLERLKANCRKLTGRDYL
jgi:hypothetical protein